MRESAKVAKQIIVKQNDIPEGMQYKYLILIINHNEMKEYSDG